MNDSDRKILAGLTVDLNTLTDRNSYISWRNRWRQALAAQTILVRQIRKARAIEGAITRTNNPMSQDCVEVAWVTTLKAGLTAQQNYKGTFYGFNSWRHSARQIGNELATLRKLSKEKAREAYLARKAEELKAKSA